jgi:hypothetical protein
MKQLNFKQVQTVNELVQNTNPQELTVSPQKCYELSVWCATQRAFVGEMQAIAKHEWMQKKVQAYTSFIANSETNQRRVEKYGVQVVKDYISAKCGDFEARYEYCVRTSAALDTMASVLMTIISSLKEEMKQLR